ncbi:MAG: hypothetical protein WA865_20565 [Spirulinaceae cyanobacterium]
MLNWKFCQANLLLITLVCLPLAAKAEIEENDPNVCQVTEQPADLDCLVSEEIIPNESLAKLPEELIGPITINNDLPASPINDSSKELVADSAGETQPGDWSSARPDGHAPIGVMGDHVHKQGEFMLSYRYMFMEMDGNRDGTNDLTDSEVLQNFMVTPKRMTMEMHMIGAMYAPTDDLTLMAMVPFVSLEMDHATRSGRTFTTNSGGIGDIKLSGLYNIMRQDRQRIHLNLGISIPTGSIEEEDVTPASAPNETILPYPMQIGSGTFDLLPGITYLGQTDDLSWGSQFNTVLRLGENSNNYTLGNQYALTGWFAKNWTDWLSTSIRLNGKTWGNIDGADSRLNPRMIPTADPDRRGGTRLDLGFGLNLYAPQGGLKGGRLAVEFELPIYQSLEGPQLETNWQLTFGGQYAF